MNGYAGKITYVDLTSGKIWDEPVEEGFARKYLGGNGFAARVLYDRVPKGADALGPENAFIVCTGPLNGTLAHGSGRAGIVTKSPLTGLFMDSYFGGAFGARLKQSGRDMVVLLGKSSKPVAVVCDDQKTELISAEDLWGLNTLETQNKLRERLGKNTSTLCIGPAGENRIPMACCISERRAAGRGGIGAVLGAKNVKAISARGTRDIPVADIKGLMKLHKKVRENFLGLTPLVKVGTPVLVGAINGVGGMGTHNWQEETWDRAENISGQRLMERHFVRNWACFACNMGGCARVVRSTQTPEMMTEGPEYETLFAIGSNCGVDDLDKLIEADRLCDDYGIDTVSLGGAIGFVMECFQRDLLSKEDTGGLDFTFGNGDTLVKCVHMVATQEGFGEFIGRGVKAMAERIGQASEKFACHIRGLELPGHSPRALKNMGFGYAVSPRGASHHDVRPTLEYRMTPDERASTKGKVDMAYSTSNWTAIRDSMILCTFCEGVFGFELGEGHVEQINLATGWDLELEELAEISVRIQTLERAFNQREGLRRKDETLPYRFMHEEIPSGNSKGFRMKPEELDEMLDQYYEKRGWDADGVPTRKTLDGLGLQDVRILEE